MKECWLNVYFDYELGTCVPRNIAIELEKSVMERYKWKVIYRIHVRLK